MSKAPVVSDENGRLFLICYCEGSVGLTIRLFEHEEEPYFTCLIAEVCSFLNQNSMEYEEDEKGVYVKETDIELEKYGENRVRAGKIYRLFSDF